MDVDFTLLEQELPLRWPRCSVLGSSGAWTVMMTRRCCQLGEQEIVSLGI